MNKPDAFNDISLGDFAADRKATNKDVLAFSRKATVDVPEQYAQDWIDPITFEKKHIFGKVNLVEYKLVSKKNGDVNFTRYMEPALKGGQVKKAL